MKKLLTYFLIFIVLMGFSSQITRNTAAAAEPAKGTCVVNNNYPGGDRLNHSWEQKTRQGCDDFVKQNNVKFVSWTAYNTATNPAPPVQTASVEGYCYNLKGTRLAEDKITAEECSKKSGGIFVTSPPVCNWKLQILTAGGCMFLADIAEPANADATVKILSPYKYLAPIPQLGETFSTVGTAEEPYPLSKYLNLMITLFIGICAALAVIMIVIGGIEYMTSELPGNKEHGKERIVHAIFGLVLALGSWTLLNEINPDILNTDLSSLTSETLRVTFTEGPEIELSGEAANVICGKKTMVNGQTATSCAEDEIVSVPFLGGTARVNKAIAQDLVAIDADWKRLKTTDARVRAYSITQLGSYNPRHATSSTQPSGHAFGLSLDINSSRNPYAASLTPCTTDMPPAFVRLFTSRGFGWGGYWKSKKDTMHFSKLPNESYSTSGTCAGLK
ncbi:MAG: M15 family metallopeptidase [Candidatus Paceibacterota bacterium]